MLPAQYRNQAFVAMRGSWNRTEMSGFKVVTVNIQPGRPPVMQDFATGWLEGKTFWGRPVYLNEMKDGSLLISDDYAGAIYRVSTAR
jgi:glucose/arabinose dehydrogenase